MKIVVKAIAVLYLVIITCNAQGQEYYIKAKDKKTAFIYYLKSMDTIVNKNPSDTSFFCINCVRFMQDETRIQSSGKTGYFGREGFTKEDLQKWHEWYEKKYGKKSN